MKILFKQILLASLLLSSLTSQAQITVDANLKDWGDTTQFKYDDQNKLWYNFKKDDQFVYLAIKKNENVDKIRKGGVQLFFSKGKIDSNALQITFAHNIINPSTQQLEYRSHDYTEINKKLFPKLNETGVLVEWDLTNIDYIPRKDGMVLGPIPANPNIFTAEVQIPLSYFDKSPLNFSICLRSKDLAKKGIGEYLKKNFPPPNSTYLQEMFECEAFTEFFGTLDLNKL